MSVETTSRVAADRGDGSSMLLLQQGVGEMIAFGREYIANPDLVERIRRGSPLNPQRPESYYGAIAEDYTDYPTLAQLGSARPAELENVTV